MPGESKPVYVYVGDLPPRIPINEQGNIPPLHKVVPYDPERQIRRMGGFGASGASAREVNLAEASSSANPFCGQREIDWKGKGKEI
ncbi:hypothetical protein N0V85_000833 [Neurospora sp. IMI 360204]|nr:hypothetical protein N0V85_000833 [Neurospora sp. IMI 360204]